jgi:hypothetical protein
MAQFTVDRGAATQLKQRGCGSPCALLLDAHLRPYWQLSLGRNGTRKQIIGGC